MRQRDSLSPDEARELDALERALAGDPVDHDLRELEDLVLDIRATAPEMTPGFAARLEHELSEGFPGGPQTRPMPRPRRWMLLPAVGSLAAVAVVVSIGLGSGGGDEPATFAVRAPALQDGRAESQSSGSTPTESGGGVARDSAEPPKPAPSPPPPAAAAPGAASSKAVAPATGVPAPPSADQLSATPPVTASKVARKVERSADLVLRVPTRKVGSTSDGVIRTVDRFGGIVASSSIGSDDSSGEATFDLRIPTPRLDDALAALSKLGHVAERRQNLVDITGSFTSAQDRLSDARAERRGLLKALGNASTQQKIDSLKARLRNVRSQIAQLDGELDSLRRRADLSRVSVTVRGDASVVEDGAGAGPWSPGDAARDALRVLEIIAGVTLIALAITGPLAILALLVALGVRAGKRRRREGALDPA